MILNRTPLSMAQVSEYIKNVDDKKPVAEYVKKFCKVSKADAEKMIEELKALDNHKIKEETMIKIVDMYPQDSEDLHKIFNDVSLTEEESNSILSIVKKY